MKRVVLFLAMLLLGLVGATPLATATVARNSATPSPSYTSHASYTTDISTTVERGPPSSYNCATTYDAVDVRSNGASARSERPTLPGATNYDDPTGLVHATSTTSEQVRQADGELLSAGPAHVAANGVSRLVPGGGLAAHEAAGGHALARHLGRTDADLLARLSAQPGITGASSFGSRSVAESSVGGLLDANAASVSSWLAGSGGKLVLNGGTGGITGRYVAQGSTSISNVTGVRAILVRDANMSVGCRIQTAFPAP